MKKLLVAFISVLLIFTCIEPVFANNNAMVHVFINDKEVEFNLEAGIPFIDNHSRTQVPFRTTLESFGAQVVWDQERQTAVAMKGDVIVEIPIGKSFIIKNGATINTDTSSQIKDGRTYLPIRPVLESFGSDVSWDPSTETIKIAKSEATSETQNKYTYGSISTSEYDYTGYLNDNLPDIYGCYTYKNGGIYRGGISDGLYSGSGRFTFNDGDEYYGSFINGQKDGTGIYKALNIAYIDGTWKKGALEGNANIYYTDRSKYVGNIKDGVRSGIGTFTFPNGEYYMGSWQNDEYNGDGKYYFSDGSFYDGTWKDGLLNGTVIYQKSKYLKYTCEFVNGEVKNVQ